MRHKKQRSNRERLSAEGIGVETLRWGVSGGARNSSKGCSGREQQHRGRAGIGPEKEWGKRVIKGLTAILWLFLEFVPSDQPPAIRWPVERLQHRIGYHYDFHLYFYYYCSCSEKQDISFVGQSLFLVYVAGIGMFVSILPYSV